MLLLAIRAWYTVTVGERLSADAVRDLFLKHGPMVYRRALRLLGDRHDAEEATQEVFIRALRGAESFEGRSEVTTWLYRITTHYCLNQIRDTKRRRDLLEARAAEDDRAEALAAPELVLLRRLLSEADEQQAKAAVYVYLDGMTHEEAAEVLGVSKRTVGNLIQRFRDWASTRTREIEATSKRSAG
jgi:RNA polymerase sigma-70 factor, ECF subfamily